MTFNATQIVSKAFFRYFNNVPEKYKDEIIESLVELNIERANIVNRAMLFLNLILVVFDLLVYREMWDVNSAYYYLFISHIAMFLYFAFYAVLLGHVEADIKKKRFLYLSYISVTLIWCVFLAINAQLIHGNIAAYIIACFGAASAYILTSGEIVPILGFTYFAAIAGVSYLGTGQQAFNSNLVNLTFTVLLSYTVSRVNFFVYVRDFINKKTILEQKEALREAKQRLELLVSERTKELLKANDYLMEEINRRQEIECESARNRSLYEEKLRALDETKEYEKARCSFFANLSHELRTPVNVIFSALQMMEFLGNNDRGIYDNKQAKYRGIIKQNCYRLIRLIGNLIDITKIDAKYQTINLQNIDIVKITESITLSISEYADSKSINLVFDTEIEEKVIACDPDMIERILLNLLSNAVKFTPAQGSIFVSVNTSAEKVSISVRDTGIGIPADKQEKVFERYVQDGKASAMGMQGSGIGLSLVKSIAEMHEGRVNLASECGKGSEFIVELPDRVLSSAGEKEESIRDMSINNIDKISIEFSDIYF